jgi:hypothetical protein
MVALRLVNKNRGRLEKHYPDINLKILGRPKKN